MAAFLRTISLWLVLYVASRLFTGKPGSDDSPLFTIAGMLLLPALAGWLTLASERQFTLDLEHEKENARRPSLRPDRRFSRHFIVRVIFWAITGAGWLALVLFAIGHADRSGFEERIVVVVAFAILAVVVVWGCIRCRPHPARRSLGELAAGIVVVLVSVAIYTWRYEAETQAFASKAEQRWAELGLPMSQLDEKHPQDAENAGTAATRNALREVIGGDLYKPREGQPRIACADSVLPQAALISNPLAGIPPGDAVVFPAEAAAPLEAFLPKLHAAYLPIVSAEAPGWASDAAAGASLDVPNFTGIRVLAQLSCADALHALSVGDSATAQQAITALLRIRDGLRRNPTLDALMLSVSLDGVAAPGTARLPAADDGLAALKNDLAALRTALFDRLRVESWIALRFQNQYSDELRALDPPWGEFLPKEVNRIASPFYVRRQFAVGARNGAEHYEILATPTTVYLQDFGASLHEDVVALHPTQWGFEPTRAIQRLYATLLLREQAELIREARARLAAGRALESHDSFILPSAHRDIVANTKENSATFRLTAAPAWLVKNEVTAPQFWLTPLDGSVPWPFATRGGNAAR